MKTQNIERIEDFLEKLEAAKDDLRKYVKGGYGSKSAAKRARKTLTEIKKEITEIKKLTMEA